MSARHHSLINRRRYPWIGVYGSLAVLLLMVLEGACRITAPIEAVSAR